MCDGFHANISSMGSQSAHADLTESLIDLNDTLQKDDGIVSTSSAARFRNQPGDIEARYTEYARTHLIQPDVDRFINDLVESLEDPSEDRSIPGYIHGPYGYGKTSSAGKVWHVLETEHNYITTPPIYFRDLHSIVDAVYGWMRHRLEGREEYLADLEECYETHAAENLDQILDEQGFEHRDDLRTELEQLLDSDAVDTKFSVDSVLQFLSECNQIAKDAGFNGLVVIADELQQFVSNEPSEKSAYAKLRDIAKSIALGLNDGDGLGLLFTMDDGLHSDLDVNADDVLARLSEQNVVLNLSSVYGRSFPAELWNTLSEKFGFSDHVHDVVTEDVLDAIGQICERGPPLSNGPRTVVDLFTTIIDHYISEKETFDALELAETYYTGRVRYKGDTIKSAITQAINAEIIDDSEEEAFIKLCGVFPRGVSDERLKHYELYEAKERVKKELHGQLLIVHEEGRTLKRLGRDDKDRGLKDEIFTEFYRNYDTTDLYDDKATQVFREVVLEQELFESVRGSGLESWRTEGSFSPETGGVYSAIFAGSFDGQKYPKRKVLIRSGPSVEVVQSNGDLDQIDLTLGFVHHTDTEEPCEPHIDRPSTDEAILTLDFTAAFETLPSNIALLDEYMSPEDVNPHLLLCLYEYIESWREERTIDPGKQQQLGYLQDQVINQSIQQLFGPPLNGDDLLSSDDSRRRTVQANQVVEEVFHHLIRDVYPDYETMFVTGKYDQFLSDYKSMLLGNDPKLRISQKRGNTSISGTKEYVANTVGVSSNASAKSRLNDQFETLADIDVWAGQDARITLCLHPLESILKDAVEEASDDQLIIDDAYAIGLEHGHRPEEVDWALQLLEARDYIDRPSDAEYVDLSDIAIDIHEVTERYESLGATTEIINEITDDWEEYSEIRSDLDSIQEELDETGEEDIERLDDLLSRLRYLEPQIEGQIRAIHGARVERCRSTLSDVEDYGTQSMPRDLKTDPNGSGVPFEMHLDDIHNSLEADLTALKSAARETAEDLRTRSESATEPRIDSITTLRDVEEDTKEATVKFENDLDQIETAAADYKQWCNFAQRLGETRSEMSRYISNQDETETVESLREELDSMLSQIQEQFQTDEREALTDANVYQGSFNDIKEKYNAITQGDREVFEFKKAILENTLREATGGHGTIRQSLSTDDPHGSRMNVRRDFKDNLTENEDGTEDVYSMAESVRTSLRYAELLNQVPADSDPDPRSIREQLDTIEEEIEAIDRVVDDFDVQEDIDLPPEEDKSESFPRTEQTLSLIVDGEQVDIADRLTAQRRKITELQDYVATWRKQTDQPHEDLRYIIDQLDYRKPTDLESIIVELAETDDTDVRVADVFDDLQALFEGNHITIELTSEHR